MLDRKFSSLFHFPLICFTKLHFYKGFSIGSHFQIGSHNLYFMTAYQNVSQFVEIKESVTIHYLAEGKALMETRWVVCLNKRNREKWNYKKKNIYIRIKYTKVWL